MTMEARRIVRFEIAYEIEIDSRGGGASAVAQRPLGKEAAWPPAAAGFDALALRVPVKKFPRHYWDPQRHFSCADHGHDQKRLGLYSQAPGI